MTPTNSNTTAHLAAFLTILCWGTTFVSTKVLLRVFMPVQILLIRFCIGFAALYFLSAKSTYQLTRRQNVYLASAGFLGICLYYVNFQRFPTLDAKKLVNAPKMSAHHRGICHF